MSFVFVADVHLYQAAYFHAITQRSNLTVNLVQLSEENNNEDLLEPALKVMEEIDNLEAEVILLYIKRDNIQLMLQQVLLIIILYFIALGLYKDVSKICYFSSMQLIWDDFFDVFSFHLSFEDCF